MMAGRGADVPETVDGDRMNLPRVRAVSTHVDTDFETCLSWEGRFSQKPEPTSPWRECLFCAPIPLSLTYFCFPFEPRLECSCVRVLLYKLCGAAIGPRL